MGCTNNALAFLLPFLMHCSYWRVFPDHTLNTVHDYTITGDGWRDSQSLLFPCVEGRMGES